MKKYNNNIFCNSSYKSIYIFRYKYCIISIIKLLFNIIKNKNRIVIFKIIFLFINF